MRRFHSAGFTLIEIIVVIGMLALVGSFGLLISMESYRGSTFRADRALLISLLQHARSDALNSVCRGACIGNDAAAHGVHIEGASYTVFQGATYAAGGPLNQAFEASPAVTRSGLVDVVFAPLTGDSLTTGTITLTGEGHTSDVIIGAEGQITWSN